jgi:hypothetical protein
MWSPARISTASGFSSSTAKRFWWTASAVPTYHCSPDAYCGGNVSTNSPSAALKLTDQPSRMWLLRDRDRYCTSTRIFFSIEFRQFESVKSMIR